MLSQQKSTAVRIVLPSATAQLLCDRAEDRWHTRSNVVSGSNMTVVQVWPERHAQLGTGFSPIGSFTIRFGSPQPSQATIVKLEWEGGRGSEAEVRRAINTLVGWPIANDQPVRPQLARVVA